MIDFGNFDFSDSLDKIGRYILAHAPVGSRVTCNPAPTDTDEDHLLLIGSGDMDAALCWLYGDGWVSGTNDDEYEELPDFRSLRNGNVNLIITSNHTFYEYFLAATSVAKRLNLLNKADRIALFQAVLYGNACD